MNSTKPIKCFTCFAVLGILICLRNCSALSLSDERAIGIIVQRKVIFRRSKRTLRAQSFRTDYLEESNKFMVPECFCQR